MYYSSKTYYFLLDICKNKKAFTSLSLVKKFFTENLKKVIMLQNLFTNIKIFFDNKLTFTNQNNSPELDIKKTF